jgi:hypothetical protein
MGNNGSRSRRGSHQNEKPVSLALEIAWREFDLEQTADQRNKPAILYCPTLTKSDSRFFCALPEFFRGWTEPSLWSGDADRDWFRFGRQMQKLHPVSKTVTENLGRQLK